MPDTDPTETALDPSDPGDAGSTDDLPDMDGGDIYGFWSICRRDDPVMTIEGLGMEMRMLTRFADVDNVLRDAERFPSRINADTMGPVMGTVILAMDGEEHRRYRNLVARAFRPSALVRWEDELIAPTIHRLLDAVAGQGRSIWWPTSPAATRSRSSPASSASPPRTTSSSRRWALEIRSGPEDYAISTAASAGHARVPDPPGRGAQGRTRPTTSSPTSSRPRSTANG